MELYYYIKAWFNYLDITFSDVFLFLTLGMMIVLGIYVFLKKDVIFGFTQIVLTLLTPYMIIMFVTSNKLYWEAPMKMWVRLMSSNHYGDLRFLSLMLLVAVPAFVGVTVKNLIMLKK